MKKLFEGTNASNVKPVPGRRVADRFNRSTVTHYCLIALLATALFTGCKKPRINEPEMEVQFLDDNQMNADKNSFAGNSRSNWKTVRELQQARAATARYRNIANAFHDGYVQIPVDVENMGHHYMKSEIVNATFEIRKPELLVYNRNDDGKLELLAVEYAVPISDSPNAAPEGFTGSADVWERNTDFDLWLLHAWVWAYNPDGVFNPTNPLVHLH